MHLYIDTNVYLSFYHLTNEGLDELEKVLALHKFGKVTLWLPAHTRREFERNRENKIADALKRFREEKLNSQIPQMAKGYPEFADLTNAVKSFNTAKEAILEKLRADIAELSLQADKLNAQIFTRASKIPLTEDIIARAQSRCMLGDPLGKRDSIGDAVNWESLLSGIPDEEPLHFVSDDGDYYSPLDDGEFKYCLLSDWATRKKSSLHAYRRISQFVSKHFPEAKHVAELEKELLIAELASSPSFAKTHNLVGALATQNSFTQAQASNIANAYLSNSQISWIATDPDVSAFGERIVKEHGDKLDPQQVHDLIALVSK